MALELERVIAKAVLDGVSLDRIEEEIIDRARIEEDERAALWLYADALLEQHTETLLRERELVMTGD
jgi:hypothetical protein